MPASAKASRIGIDTLFLSGKERSSLANFVVELTKHLVLRPGKEVYIVFATREVQRFFSGVHTARLRFVTCPIGNDGLIRRILYQQLWLPVLIRRHGIDAMCCLADVVPLATSAPIVLKINTLHHYKTPEALGAFRRWYRTVMIQASSRKAKIIVANSQATVSDIERLLSVAPARIRLVYEAVDDFFQPCENDVSFRESLNKRYGVDPPYMLFVSVLYPYKNLNIAIQALGVLRTQYGWPGTLVVAGSDPYGTRPGSEALARSLALHDRVIFLGSLDNRDLRDLYCGASVFLYPSSSETFGKPIVEAMRCETPIVAARAGSIPEIAGDAAILVDVLDAQGLADAAWSVISDPQRRERLRSAARARGGLFSWHSVADGFLSACREVLPAVR